MDTRVLVVDDDRLFAKGLARDLASLGARTSVVHDLPSARRALTAEDFDLIVLDFRLEDVDGPALLETWPGDKPLPPTIVLSGFVGIRETVRAMRAGALDVLKKPTGAAEVVRCFQRFAEPMAPPALRLAAGEASVLVGDHPAVRAARQVIGTLSRLTANVILVGEAGTGRHTLARSIHEASAPEDPFVSVDCAAIPEALFEEELLGNGSPGSGLLAQAGAGTLYFSEVTAIPQPVQLKLLEAVTRQTSDAPGKPRALLISAAEHGLHEVNGFNGTLRQVLCQHTIVLPPLRARRKDIEPLALHFLEQFAARHPSAPRKLTKNASAALLKHPWPGNIRELRAVMEHCAAVCESPELSASIVQAVLGHRTSPAPPGSGTHRALNFRGSLPELERDTIVQAFRASGNNISEAARLVGLPRSTVRDKLKRYGIR